MKSEKEDFTVSFFGHRYIENLSDVESKLEAIILSLIDNHSHINFLVGKNGEFDTIVSSTIKRIKKRMDINAISHILVLPYDSVLFRKNEKNFYDYYDEIEICRKSDLAHYKSAFQIRNKEMIDRSDLCVFFVQHNRGGAYKSLKYAAEKNKKIINITV